MRVKTSLVRRLIVVALVGICSFNDVSAETLWPGSGDANDPYQISDADGLKRLSEDSDYWDRNFILTADILIPPGYVGNSIGDHVKAFTGRFDGQDHSIKGLTIRNFFGLFGKTGAAAEIINLGLIDADMALGMVNRCGLLAGENYGTIENCYCRGVVKITSSNDLRHIGGMVGYNYGTINNCYYNGDVVIIHNGTGNSLNAGGLAGVNAGTIENCYSAGRVTASSTGGEIGRVGGLVGLLDNGTIANCYSKSDIFIEALSASRIGGLAGRNIGGSIANCYSTGNVSASGSVSFVEVGGLIGLNGSGGTVSNSFWDIWRSDQATSSGGTGKTTAEMKTETTFTDVGWNFVETWGMWEVQSCPLLRAIPLCPQRHNLLKSDLNRDCRVDFIDFSIMLNEWLQEGEQW